MVDPESRIVQMAVKRWADLELRKGKNLSISPQTLTVRTNNSLYLGHDHFLPHPFQLIIYYYCLI
jgi:hypothetical protein